MKSFYSFIFVLAFSLLTLSHPAVSAYEEFEYSEAEKVGFSFYHFAGYEPDFKKWIMEYNYYLNAKPSKKNRILREDEIRLQQGYRQFSPERDYIKFKAEVQIHIPRKEKRADFLNKYQKIPVKIKLPPMLEIPRLQETYLPFYVGGMWYALIPENYKDLQIIYMDQDEFHEFTNQFVVHSTTVKDAHAEFVLRVKSVDAEAPFPIGDTESWLMMGEIGNMKIRHKRDNAVLWEYEAPWYIPETRQDLINLFTK